MKAATFEGVTPKGLVTPELIDYHLRPVGAGWDDHGGLPGRGPRGRTDDGCIWLRPAAVPGLRQLVDTIHDEGALVAGQLGHAGPVANAAKNGVPSLSASREVNPISMKVTRSITETEIERVTMDYAGRALMAEAGFDSIEIHLAHNYLLSSFLSPKFNRRKDDWAGAWRTGPASPARSWPPSARRPAHMAVTAKISLDDGVTAGSTCPRASSSPGCSKPTATSTPSR